MFQAQLTVDEEVASILVQEGFTSVEEVAYVPESELLDIEEFDEDIVAELRNRARDALLTRAIATEEALGSNEPSQELLDLEGMDQASAWQLAAREITTLEDLAEQAVDDLLEIEGIDEEWAARMIMKAREPWFAESEAAEPEQAASEQSG
jgi:N utilization substance protein A